MRYDQAFQGEGYHSALLTTYSFDPTVFENVLLVAMRSRGCRNIGILADQDMVNRTLSELAPAPRAGTAYHLAKKKVARAFHSKIVLQLGATSGKLMVGSANLTGAGLVGNLETVTTMSVTDDNMTAAPLLARAFDYFELHSDSDDRAMHDVLTRARVKTPWLAEAGSASEVMIDGQRVSFIVEDKNRGVGKGFRAFVGDDPINRLIVVSPYANETLDGFSRLRNEFGDPPTALVVDPYEQDFTADVFSTQGGATLHSTEAHEWGGARRLHAKLIVACGRQSDYVLAGSSNVSTEGLYSRYGGPGNAEAAIARTEPPGTAIERLLLLDCLSIPMPLLSLKLRSRGAADYELRRVTQPDGGSFWLQHAALFWRPPSGVVPNRCSVRLFDNLGGVIATVQPVHDHGYWTFDIKPGTSTPRLAIVIYPYEVESAPVPIASLSSLQLNSIPVRTGPAGRILAELEGRDEIDLEDYDRAMKLLALSRLDSTKKRDVKQSRPNEDEREKEEAKTLSPEEFGRIAYRSELRHSLKSGPISEIRRFINSCIGLRVDIVDDDDDLDALARQLAGKGKGKSKHSGPKSNLSPAGYLDKKGELTWANERADRLVGHVDYTCRALSPSGVDPLSLESAIRLHLLINVFLKACSPVGAKPTARYPISATDKARSWVRIMGRLLYSLERPIAKQVQRMSEGVLEEECVEVLASILFCASLILDAARAAKMPRVVVSKLEGVNGSLARSVGQMLADKPIAEAYMRTNLPKLATAHRLVPQKSV
jgi:hypothetical protein